MPPELPRPISFGDERLIRALTVDGCGLCSVSGLRGADFLETALTELVTDPAFRATIVAGGGFCARHVRMAVAIDRERIGGTTAAAVVFASIIRARRAALLDWAARRRPGRSGDQATAPAGSCAVCQQESLAVGSAVDRMIGHAAIDHGWRDKVVGSRWCVVHLGILARRVRRMDGALFQDLVSSQAARMADLTEQLERLSHLSAQDRRHLVSAEDQESVSRAVELLSGGLD
jgi:hypothetical protein